jgi:hypothetical protein
MILRASFANITPRALAELVQASSLSGSIFESLGAGAWGIEPGAAVEFAFLAQGPQHPLLKEREAFIQAVLRVRKEEAAYVTAADQDTRAYLYWQDGRVERIG